MIIKNIGYRELSADDRKGIIGGSQVGALMGLRGYVSKYAVWRAYMGYKDEISEETAWAFFLGHEMEKTIAASFSFKTGIELEEVPLALYDKERPYIILHPDRQFALEINGKRYAVECKNASVNAVKKHWVEPVEYEGTTCIDDKVVVYDESSLPPQYRAQCYWYTAFGYDGVFLARMTDNQLFVYYVESDERVERALYNSAVRFRNNTEAGIIPEPENSRQIALSYPDAENTSIMIDSESLDVYKNLLRLKDEKADLELDIELDKSKLMGYMKDNERLISQEGKTLVSWKKEKRKNFDLDSFKKDHPELYSRYLCSNESRVLRISEE